MPLNPRHLLPALLTVLVALLLGAPVASAGSSHSARARVGASHAVGQAQGCARHLSPARVKGMKPAQRKRQMRRLRSCRRRLASQSTVPAAPLYWGAWIGEQLTGAQAPWDMSAVTKFEQIAGKPLSLINFSSPFADCTSSPCTFYKFPTDQMEGIRLHGSIPFFSWASQSTPSSLDEPNFQLSDVIAGTYDSYIREFAEGAKAWGHPFFLRFNWEMNGNWFPWSEGVNGNAAGEYVAAWRHVHDIFAEVGATNATWVWCPNVDPAGKLQSLGELYPGDEYVDWTSLDGYNWGTMPGHGERWRTFNQLFSPTYHSIVEQIAPSKPMLIGEVGSTEQGGSKAAWITEMLKDLPTEYPQIRGVQWFEKIEEADWPIESSPSSASAFAAGIQNISYKSNEYASLETGTIQPPS